MNFAFIPFLIFFLIPIIFVAWAVFKLLANQKETNDILIKILAKLDEKN